MEKRNQEEGIENSLVNLEKIIDSAEPNTKELLIELKRVILKQRGLMEKFFETINSSSTSGFSHAIVLRSQKIEVTGFDDKIEKFNLNDKVTVHPDSVLKHAFNYDLVGTIIEIDPEGEVGWALVQFSSGRKQPFRYGNPLKDNGACDLMLFEKKLVDQVERNVLTVSYRNEVIDVIDYLLLELSPGDTVLIHPQTNVVIGKTTSIDSGRVGYVEELLLKECIVTVDSTKHSVIIPPAFKCERGDRVVLDAGLNVILRVLPKTKSIAITDDIKPVEWNDVIGLNEAKTAAMDMINFMKYPELYKAYGTKRPKGAIMVGPTGVGKTHMGRAVATQISREFGAEDGVIKGFMYIKASEILDMFVGEAPKKVREIFTKAKEFYQLTGQMMIMFLDECDVVLKVRGNNKNGNSSSDEITNAFLTEMDGISESCAFILAATNRIDLIDTAVLREGRLDRIIFVDRPEEADIPKFFSMYLKNTLLQGDVDLEGAIEFATKEFTAPDYTFYDLLYAKEGINCEDESVSLQDRFDTVRFNLLHVGSGATIETIVNNARLKAIKRDIESESKAATGITLLDLRAATKDAFESAKLKNPEEFIKDYTKKNKAEPYKVIPKF